MKLNKILAATLLTVMVSSIILSSVMKAFPSPPPSYPHDANAVWIEPTSLSFNTSTTTLPHLFNVTVYVNVTGTPIFNYQVNITCDPTQLNLVEAGYTHGGESAFFYPKTATSPGPSYGPVSGMPPYCSAIIGEALLSPNTQTGFGSLIWAEFNITARPSPGGTLTSEINITNPDTWVQESNYTLPPVSTFNAVYTFTSPKAIQKLPVPVFDYSPKSPVVNQTITFDASASYDPVGTIVTWAWSFGDTGTASGETVTHKYKSPGTYLVNLTVTDNGSHSNSTTESLTVYTSVTLIHDVAIVGVIPSRNTTFPGLPVKIAVTAKDLGQFIESFNVSAYYNSSLIETQQVVKLNASQQITLMFTWNTTGLTPRTNYIIKGVASYVLFEFNKTNNVLLGGKVYVSIFGDIGGYGKVDMRDIGIVAAAFGSYGPDGPDWKYPGLPASPRWDPRADITSIKYLVPDNKVDIFDVAFIARNFGQH